MRRSLGAVVATTAAAAVLTACGGDSPYCATIRDTEGQLRAIGNAATDADLATAAGAAQRIADVAPEPVDADWRGIASALTSFAETLKTVGITYQDLLAQQNLQDLTDDDRAKLTTSLEQLRQANSSTVTTRINDQVQDECDIVIRPS
ncbi:hypothetical protein [Solicola sp. PLA-1-18]|uniref:hypothetical protein n=1 Tax=Solicola sp. PLA-1-18 TaxID=3380532 RepID=UPI003B760C65